MNVHPDIDCYFIEYSQLTFVPILSKDTLVLRGRERYDTILAKTIDALSYLLPKKNYTHVVRTNLSCVWDFTALLTFLGKQPSTRFYGGIALQNGGASGAGILFSRDTAELLVKHRQYALSIGTTDDDDIGTFMQRFGIPLTISDRVDFLSLKHYEEHHDKIPPGSFHFRMKVRDPAEDRMNETTMMRGMLLQIQNQSGIPG